MSDSLLILYGYKVFTDDQITTQRQIAVAVFSTSTDSLVSDFLIDSTLVEKVEGTFGLDLENDSIGVFGGTVGWYLLFPDTVNYFVLTRANFLTGEILDWRYFGGDAYYNLWGMKRTYDNGYLVWGSVFTYGSSSQNQRDPFFMKIDSAGIITHASHAIEALDVLAFPNPGKDRLNFRLPAEMAGTAILYDLNGKAVLQSPFQGKEFSLETASLPAGVYVYRLLTSRQQVLTGKWIKVE